MTSLSQKYRMQGLSGVFSRGMIMDMLNYGDYSRLDTLSTNYAIPSAKSYMDYLCLVYAELSRSYRCEYVFKNELLAKLLAHYRGLSTIAFSEFKMDGVVADMVLVNGESRAFEIKTEYDTPKRLERQLSIYRKVFDRCYIVVPSEKAKDYSSLVPKETGIIAVNFKRGKVHIDEEYRKAELNTKLDAYVMIRSLRTPEYKNIVKSFYGGLPDVNDFEMFKACEERMASIPSPELSALFKKELKKRKNSMVQLRSMPQPIRQLCLAMNLKSKEMEQLLVYLSNPIKL